MAKNKDRKKVLVITYYWPPSGGAGVQRWLKFVKYLRDSGWEPVIYTPSNPESPAPDMSLIQDIPPGIEVISTKIWEPYEFYKKLVGMKKNEKMNAGFLSEKKKPGLAEKLSVWIRGNFFIPDARKFWIKPSIRFLTKYLRENPVDAMVSTGPPHSMHLIAMGVKKSHPVPWLADFRDPWTGIDFYDRLHLLKRSDNKHRRLEKLVLQQADAVTVVSRQMQEEFAQVADRQYHVITNGYDKSDISLIAAGEVDAKFSMAHIGSIAPSRNPVLLWKEMARKIAEEPGFADHLEIKFIGKVDHSVLQSIEEQGLSRYLNKIDYLPHNTILAEMQKSQVLLLLINKTPNAKGILTGKLFEYLAARRPVLCIGPDDGDASKILLETKAGSTAGFEDSAATRGILDDLYKKYKAGTLKIDPEGIEKYSRKELTKVLAGVLESITA